MNKMQEYIARYKGIHTGKDNYLQDGVEQSPDAKGELFSGVQFMRKFPVHIKKQIQQKGSVSILDYGCGKGQHLWRRCDPYTNGLLGKFRNGIQTFFLYDPAVPGFDKKPDKKRFKGYFDIVASADVMEHVPEEFVPEVLSEIAHYLSKDGICMLAISANPARKSFLDGENLHCTIKSAEWWIDAIKAAGIKKYLLIHTDDSLPQPVRTYESDNAV